jgi:CMP-N,N'-diacetyllegionaminic acid synthase
MRILALITARGDSKRIPRKNSRLLGGKPLITWSIDVAKRISHACDVLVSTDDSEIAKISKNAGAFVPWLRPSKLATDNATSEAVALHAVDWYENEKGKVDGLLLLQPTSPFRKSDTVYRGITLFQEHNFKPVVSISPTDSHPMWCVTVKGMTMGKFIETSGRHLRSQELPPAFMINGAFYLIRPEDLRKHESFYSDEMVPLVMHEPAEGLDIDTEWDWMIAEAFLKVADSKKFHPLI